MSRRIQLLALALVLIIGCEAFYESPQPVKPVPTPTPTPLATDAAACLRNYGAGIADAFERSAEQFEQHAPSLTIVNDMGDALKQARVDAFMPLMERLNDLRPGPGATDDERAAADVQRAQALREWAEQLRSVRWPK